MTEQDHPIYKNALDAIQVGVEDFKDGSPRRLGSAVRSLAAGLLLLCKEKLRRLSPDDEILIWKNIKPVPGDGGQVVLEHVGNATLDVQGIEKRFQDFGIQCETKLLQDIAKVRNAVEHHYVEDVAQVRTAFTKGLHFMIQFMPEHLGVSPHEVLGSETWTALVEQKEIEDELLKVCRQSYAQMTWIAPLDEIFQKMGCPECASPLYRQVDPENKAPYKAIWRCDACGHADDAEGWVGDVMNEYYWGEAFLAAKDGADPPTSVCPECGLDAYVHEVFQCIFCGFEFEGGECLVCGEYLGLEDYGGNLCSYHRYVADKERDS
jgi:ribosomal protein L37AE/L43A